MTIRRYFAAALLVCAVAAVLVYWLISPLTIGHAQELVKVPRSDGAETPLRVYAPTAQGCAPLALISPGAGGSEDGYAYLAEGLRKQGWLAVVMGHKESGSQALRKDIRSAGLHGGLEKMVTDQALQQDRLMDVTATLKWAEQQCKHPYKALMGHSMGTDTVMFEAGAQNKLGVHGGEDRFDAYVAISPSGTGSIFPEHAWSSIRKPLFVLTGTRDKGLEGPWQWRTQPFDDLPPGCKWLGIIDDATHLNFAGIGFASKTKRLTLASIHDFLEDARNNHCSVLPTEDDLTLRVK